MAVIGVLREIERTEDDAMVLADGQRGLGSELILLVRLALDATQGP